jgi:hypothetical protein
LQTLSPLSNRERYRSEPERVLEGGRGGELRNTLT